MTIEKKPGTAYEVGIVYWETKIEDKTRRLDALTEQHPGSFAENIALEQLELAVLGLKQHVRRKEKGFFK